jgi:hypothetical protein
VALAATAARSACAAASLSSLLRWPLAALSLTIPLSMLADFVFKKEMPSLYLSLGSLCVIVGFVAVSLQPAGGSASGDTPVARDDKWLPNDNRGAFQPLSEADATSLIIGIDDDDDDDDDADDAGDDDASRQTNV